MKLVLKLQTITVVVCILCAPCVAPVMAGAGTHVNEDGAHLVKFDDSPTKLDPRFYIMDVQEDFVVDGNQCYWVRIGSVKSATLSKNQLALLACKGTLVIGAGAASGLIIYVAGAGEVTTAGTGSPWILPTAFGAISGIMTFYADTVTGLCPVVEKWFVDNNFRVVANDGTILLGIKKTNNEGIQGLKKVGIDIEHLHHLPAYGNTVKTEL